MTGKGTSFGAITVINAMPCGIGSTIGVSLKTDATFMVGGTKRSVTIGNDPSEDTEMARICVSETYLAIGVEEPTGWDLRTDSEIPISRGLKSSSSACNAIISAVLAENNACMNDMDIIRLGVRCARAAKVTVTGSFDDACGCKLGGLVMTDNTNDSLIMHKPLNEFDVIIHVPDEKIRKIGLPLDKLKGIAPDIRRIIGIVRNDPFEALTLNGRLISSVSGVDNSVAEIALKNGALGAGMTGSGPAVAIVLEKGDTERFLKKTDLENYIITTTRSMTG